MQFARAIMMTMGLIFVFIGANFFSFFFPALAAAVEGDGGGLDRFVWPNQWSGIQEISIVSGKFAGALQRGRIAYDYINRRTREDQVLISGPSVKTPETSNNMTEWFNGSHWYYMDWTTGSCQSANFGIGMVKPDWLIADASFPRSTGATYIHAFVPSSSPSPSPSHALPSKAKARRKIPSIPPRSNFKRQYVNASWVWVDGSEGFGEPPLSSVFEWYVSGDGGKNTVGHRLRMPSTLSADLVVDIQDFAAGKLDPAWFDIPLGCFSSTAGAAAETPASTIARRRGGGTLLAISGMKSGK